VIPLKMKSLMEMKNSGFTNLIFLLTLLQSLTSVLPSVARR